MIHQIVRREIQPVCSRTSRKIFVWCERWVTYKADAVDDS